MNGSLTLIFLHTARKKRSPPHFLCVLFTTTPSKSHPHTPLYQAIQIGVRESFGRKQNKTDVFSTHFLDYWTCVYVYSEIKRQSLNWMSFLSICVCSCDCKAKISKPCWLSQVHLGNLIIYKLLIRNFIYTEFKALWVVKTPIFFRTNDK